MKKIITTILAATLILSTTACGQNTEIEALKEENEQLRAQLEDSNKPTETPTENIITPESLSDKYDQIQYGMSYSQVVEILGSEGTVSRSISNPMPDNCDYYIISDTVKAQKNSKWKIVDITEFAGALEGLSNTEKNRYFKMHPDKVFKNYKYSIYIDGNVKVITDLTEMVNKIGSCGVAIHKHGKRDCVYDEVNTILAMKKDTKENLEKHIEFLKKIGFPKHYGLLECNIIAREHFNPTCQKLMDMWWQDFMTLSKRDQMSLPSVLFRNDIPVSEVGVLGTGVENDYAIRVEGHR